MDVHITLLTIGLNIQRPKKMAIKQLPFRQAQPNYQEQINTAAQNKTKAQSHLEKYLIPKKTRHTHKNNTKKQNFTITCLSS